MEYVSADVLFKQAQAYLAGQNQKGEPHERNLDKARTLLHEILDHNPGSDVVLYVMGSLELSAGHPGMAVTLLQLVTSIKPNFGEAWNNLGLAYRAMNQWDKAAACVEQAGRFLDDPDVHNNIVATYLNRNMPEVALEHVNRVLDKHPNHVKAQFHKALALLEMGKWAEAWDLHESRLIGGGNEDVAHRNYHGETETPTWDGVSPGRVVVHGEQGMGDEVMFASCMPDILKVPGIEVIFEPSPRMEKIFSRSFPKAKVYGTNDVDGRSWIPELGKPDYKIALGSLAKLYRRDAASFPGTPYLIPDKDKRAWWGDKLRALGRKPNIGIAWQGGVASTRHDARSFHPGHMKPIFDAVDANWISLQYDATAQNCVKEVRENQGVKIHHWPKAVEQKDPDTGKASDLDELVALSSKLDLVISVCNTNIHVAGALGIPCICLVPSEPSWRYGAGETTKMPWYSSVTLLRQAKGSRDWNPVIAEAAIHLQQILEQRKVM